LIELDMLGGAPKWSLLTPPSENPRWHNGA
jgi:hypothetical protein